MKDGCGYSINCCDKNHKSALLKRLFLLTQKTWLEIESGARHAQGSEKIPRAALKASAIDGRLTPDTQFIALRYQGKHPIVGFRDGRVFNIIIIDHTMDAYSHG